MELTTKIILGNKRAEVISLTHQGQELRWQPIERTSIEEGLDVFEQINGFWASQPVDWQNQVFEVYSWIHEIMSFGGEVENLMRELTKPITSLLDLHDLGEIRHWVDFKSNMGIPGGIRSEYQEEDSSRWSREKTYTLADYREFVALSVALRPMLPVWGEFIFLTKREFKTTWKEYFAFQLISQAQLMESPAMIRLKNYIGAQLPEDEELNNAVLQGISTLDYPEWITGIIVVRRLAIADIRGLPDKPNAISFIFLYLNSRTKSYNNTLMGQVQKKRNPENYSSDAESKLSQLEEYKIKQDLTAGELESIEFEFNDPIRVAQACCPDLDLALLSTAQETVLRLSAQQIHKPQLVLIAYVLSRHIPGRAIELLQKHSVLQAMAITQAILWHRGFYDLAALVSADEQRNRLEYAPGFAGAVPKVSKDLHEQLDPLYPYGRRLSSKNKTQKERNNAIIALDALVEQFKKHDWVLTLPSQWLLKVTGGVNDRKYTIPVDLKIGLTQLIFRIATRSL